MVVRMFAQCIPLWLRSKIFLLPLNRLPSKQASFHHTMVYCNTGLKVYFSSRFMCALIRDLSVKKRFEWEVQRRSVSLEQPCTVVQLSNNGSEEKTTLFSSQKTNRAHQRTLPQLPREALCERKLEGQMCWRLYKRISHNNKIESLCSIHVIAHTSIIHNNTIDDNERLSQSSGHLEQYLDTTQHSSLAMSQRTFSSLNNGLL